MERGIIDVRGLPEQDVKLLRALADLLKSKAKQRVPGKKGKQRKISIGTHDSDVVGGLTRQEIYDHL